MEIFDGYRSIAAGVAQSTRSAQRAVALGNFDGVHVGHRALLTAAIDYAGSTGGDSTVLTFDPHPAVVLAPEFAPKRITSNRRRLELFEAAGIDVCIVEPFTRELAALSPTEFFENVLLKAVRASHVVVGYDFTFGKERSGTVATLQSLGVQAGVSISVIDAVAASGIVASSTKVRNFIGDGNLSGVRLLLGRNYDIDGLVVRGAQRGRELGYPTANLRPDIEIIAPTGIYASWVTVLSGTHAGQRLKAATSLGTNPTFERELSRTLEPHILDWSGDLYGERLRVELVEYLRPEKRFSSVSDLIVAIDSDIAETRRVLAAATDAKNADNANNQEPAPIKKDSPDEI